MKSLFLYRMALIANFLALGYCLAFAQQVQVIACSSFNLCILYAMNRDFRLQMLKWWKGTGNTDKPKDVKKALEGYLFESEAFISDTRKVLSKINEIGQPSFTEMMQAIEHIELKESLLAANHKIISLSEKELQNNWISQGVAAVAELKHKGSDLEEYTFQAITHIIKYLKANQGAFFLLRQEGEEAYFEQVAAYAYGKKKYVDNRIAIGEGLVGQVYYDKEMIYLTDVPANYIRITSGLGQALPRCVCVVPLITEGQIFGALEIASFNTLSSAEKVYLTKIAENIGYNLRAIEGHRRTEKLLEESQKMAQEVKMQEEELRQNMEELSATQENMRKKQTEMDAVLSSLSTVELDLEGQIISANEIFLGITGYALADIKGRLYKNLIPQHGNDPIQYEIMWSSILSGRTFSGEFRIVNKEEKEMWMVGNFTPIVSENKEPYKIMVISLFTTQDKEKLFELQETITAIKSCFPIAELNHDLSFKTANDLFLNELGIRRIELKQSQLHKVLANGSFKKVENHLSDNVEPFKELELEIQNKDGNSKRFSSSLVKITGSNEQRKKSLLILRNPI